MQRSVDILINTADIELWPARLLTARSSRDARTIAQSRIVLRRKRDGAYLATDLHGGVLPLRPRLMHERGIHAALDALDQLREPSMRRRRNASHDLPFDGLHEHLDALDIDPDAYARRTGLAQIAEPSMLNFAGHDRYRRPLWLAADTARAWQRMQRAAREDAIDLDVISGYRSHAYQAGIFHRKLMRGDALDAILRVNAAPGYSEHHSGNALDIGTPLEPPAEASFESTSAFGWLRDRAATHGFTMSYPRDNPHGIVFEPWHWAYQSP